MLDFLDVELLKQLGFYKENREILMIVFKILFITFISLVFGLNRELKQKPVGVKTLVIIGVTSTVLTMISVESAEKFMELSSSGAILDPMRLPAQIVSGVGFLGAGVIFVKRSMVISGLTTAAMVWGVACLGIAVGAGYSFEVVVAMIVIMVVLEGLNSMLGMVGVAKKKRMYVVLKMEDDTHMTLILKKMKERGIVIRDLSIKKDVDNYRLDIITAVNEDDYVTDMYVFLNGLPSIVAVEIKQ